MKHEPFRSDLRVCASEEPKPELTDLASAMFRRSTKTGNVLSAIKSQGFRKRKASAPGYLKLMPDPSGKGYQQPERRFVPESRFGVRKDSRKALL
jgi:hypothetical protein